MIVYNITTKVSAAIEDAWLKWQQEEYIPETMATGFFTAFKIFRLLEQDDSDGNTYAIQYTANTAGHYDEYRIACAPVLQQKAFEKWGGKTISFCSILEVIH